MSKIQNLEKEDAPSNIASIYDAVEKKLGLVPNMVKALGNSPAALQGYLGLSGAVANGKLRPAIREKIALLIAETNQCDYCLSAHSAIGGSLRIAPEELQDARNGNAIDAKEQAILNLTKAILETKGAVPGHILESAGTADVTDEEAVEVVANVAVNLFTNYFNRFAETEIDFPRVEACRTCAAA